ncbi:beta-defensin 121 [Fukomys damarensis]|uniref:beta-defensin 121 n=1 Tax=Fukomys damarensis TaxID=885580 RepID=UPI00053FACF9|nr:beta-defensin 121 [Fukomys damarensis]
MKLLLLVLAVTMYLSQTISVKKCWGTSGRCRTTCKKSEVFYILCKTAHKCCVKPKHVPKLGSSNMDGRRGSSSAV